MFTKLKITEIVFGVPHSKLLVYWTDTSLHLLLLMSSMPKSFFDQWILLKGKEHAIHTSLKRSHNSDLEFLNICSCLNLKLESFRVNFFCVKHFSLVAANAEYKQFYFLQLFFAYIFWPKMTLHLF